MNDYVIVDTETSGLDERSDEIIRLAALRIKNGEITDRFSSYCKPAKLLEKEVEVLTEITNENLENQPSIIDLLPDFLHFIGDDVIVTHCVDFDLKFINAALEKINIQPLHNETVDISLLAREKILLRSYTLGHIADFLSVGGNACEETVFAVYEMLKGLPEKRMLSANEYFYLVDLRHNSQRDWLSVYLCERYACLYLDELGKIPDEDFEGLQGEELELFDLQMALDWGKTRKYEASKIYEKYDRYLNGLSKTDREYDKRVARVRGDYRKLGRY